MRLPTPRGELGISVHDLLRGPVDDHALLPQAPALPPADAALTLWVLQELHYRGFDDVDERWEWSPALGPVRRRLEDALEVRLRRRWSDADVPDPGGDIGDAVLALADGHDGPSVARFVQRRASREQTDELLRQRSIYHLKEADPTSWVLPRLEAEAKAPLAAVQLDEYGAGESKRLHHAIFARGLADAGLDDAYGAHVDSATVEVLEQNVAVSLFGLQRRLRGAALGHFAAFEATSSVPSRRMAQGLRRLGYPESLAAYYDEHVEADAVHEQLAARDVCGALVADDPARREDVLFGAWTCLDLEARAATALLRGWGVA